MWHLLCSLFVCWWGKFQPYVSFVLLLWTWRDVESVELMTMNCLIRNSFLYQLQFPPVPHSNALISLPPAPWVVLCPAENRAAQEASAFHEEHEACSLCYFGTAGTLCVTAGTVLIVKTLAGMKKKCIVCCGKVLGNVFGKCPHALVIFRGFS